jgi:cell division protein FtsB
LKENAMRVPMLALTLVLTCAAGSAPAQTVIDVEAQKAAQPREQDQGQARSEAPPSTQTQENPQANTASRFSFSRVENGFLRLDNDSGQVAYCSAQTVGWTCQAVPVTRGSDIESVKTDVTLLKGLKTEIARLQEEIASLKNEIAALKEPSPPPPADLTPHSDKGPDVTIKLPTPEEMARARDFIEGAWRRLVEMIVTIQKDLMRKS